MQNLLWHHTRENRHKGCAEGNNELITQKGQVLVPRRHLSNVEGVRKERPVDANSFSDLLSWAPPVCSGLAQRAGTTWMKGELLIVQRHQEAVVGARELCLAVDFTPPAAGKQG